jgi:16S rRNA (guanine527-N7)-methyltransferase
MSYFKTWFPALSEEQLNKLDQLQQLYKEWNTRINVVSRQDIENLNERHVLHSLAIAAYFEFKPGAQILDLGTGGGFPGVPLAIFFPDTLFTLVDGTGKKIKVVQEVANALQLNNVKPIHTRAEELKRAGQFDFIVSRAVAPLADLMQWSQHLLKKKHSHAYPNGLIALKGGNLQPEIAALPGNANNYVEVMPIKDKFNLPFFDEKWVVYTQG